MATKPMDPTTKATSRPTTTTTSRSSALDRPLPHSEDAERALLGSMLREREAIGEAITALQATGGAVFFHERYQTLYDFIVELYDHDRSIDGVIIKDELGRRGLFDKLGGYDFLTGLISAVPSALRARDYARIVLEKHLLRQLISTTHRVMETAFEDAQPPQETLDYAEQEIFQVTEKRIVGGAVPLTDLVMEAFKQIEQRGDKPLTGEPTGFYKLDEITCGLQPSELIIIAARPSMGKTALGLNIAEHLAIVENRPVLFFSLEMSRQQLAQRVLCSRARVDSQRLRRGMLSRRELDELQRAANDLTHKPLYVDDVSSLTILELRARARMMFRRHGIRAIFVDYLQLMHSPNSESRQVEVAGISRGLKALAKELDVPVIAMAQLNRNPEERGRAGGNRPRMSNLRESGAIEQDADVVILLHREDYYRVRGADDEQAEPDNVAELIIAKQRNGPTDVIKLQFSSQYTRFNNPSFQDDPGGYIPAGNGGFSPDSDDLQGEQNAPF